MDLKKVKDAWSPERALKIALADWQIVRMEYQGNDILVKIDSLDDKEIDTAQVTRDLEEAGFKVKDITDADLGLKYVLVTKE